MKTHFLLKGQILILLILCFINNGITQDLTAFKKSLNEIRIGKTDYYISLPKGYVIKESSEYGFKTVFYFQPPDSARNPLLTGGIYIGTSPKIIPPMKDTCLVIRREEMILKQSVHWIIYECEDTRLLQSIFNENTGDESSKINPFVTVKKKIDIEKILFIFSTLKKK